MGSLLRLVYVSRAVFDATCGAEYLEPEVANILAEARDKNRKANIGGALYFADGFFFQCLEGKERVVHQLFDRIKHDPRHKDVKISYCKRVRRRCFSEWSMKYVPVAPEVLDVMESRGYPEFSPVNFDESDINLIMDLFVRLEDSTLNDANLRESHRAKAAWWQKLFGNSL